MPNSDNRARRHTRQRQVILEELRKVKSHPTAAGIFEMARCRLPNISLGTVYRNLDALVEMGAVQRLAQAGSEARFDGDISHHDHVCCVRCGRFEDLKAPPLELRPPPPQDCDGYRIVGHHLQFLGVCPDCQQLPRSAVP